MDITSPSTLWKDYDVLALPLNMSALSQKTENGITVKEYYFDGYTTVDGRTRTYIKIYENPAAQRAVLCLADKSGKLDDALFNTLYQGGYTVAVMDYLGRSDNAKFTLYPRSLSACNLYGVEEFTINDEQTSNWYIWTCMARRAIKLIQELYANAKVYTLGIGLGGSTVYKLAAFEDGLTACATLRNIIPNVQGEGNSLINYRASLDNTAYAPFCTVPLFMAVSSNDEDGSFDDMAELTKNTASLKHFRIAERAFSGGINAVYSDLLSFFDNRAKQEPYEITAEISPSNSEKNLYFNIEIKDVDFDAHDIAVKLFVSFCIEDAPYRNWMSIPLISLGKDKYMTKINVCDGNKPINAFANIIYDKTTVYSTNLLGILPKALGIASRAGVSHRKIYDGSMGEDGWTSRDGGAISLVNGPYGIEGVTSQTNSLITFKPGDPLFRVPADTLLQLMLSGEPQKITVSVNDKNNSFECTVDITADGEWNKFSLSHMNFKGSAGMLHDWSQISLLEFKSDKQFIIGSVLWV